MSKLQKVQEAWERAAICSNRAQAAGDEESRKFFTHLRDSWIKAANRYQMSRLEEGTGSGKFPPTELGEGLPR
jgi:hypothetical protein